MIYSFQQIAAIKGYLERHKEALGDDFRYKLVKHLNHATSVYIYAPNGGFQLDLSKITVGMPIGSDIPHEEISVNDERIFPSVDVRYIGQEDYEEDKDYYDAFFADDSSFEGVTRRLSNAFGRYGGIKDATLPPIVSFYSYKGGVGRTTALAALASYHARRVGAKILILDCDFEAPGLVNFFGMNEDDLAAKGGIVEYLTDVAYLKNKKSVDISNYIHTIAASASKDPLGYAGEKGEIYVMNAGNVSVNAINGRKEPYDLRSHQDHYLHGLARLDFANPDHIVGQFQEMLLQANAVYHPDLILIDSRTGFNDILNNIVLRLSDIVVGFFGTSKQNIPGLYNFLDAISAEGQRQPKVPEIILINAIAPNVRQSFKNFKSQIEIYNEDTESQLNPDIFSIEYIPRMAEIGTPTDDGDMLLDYTDPNRYAFPDYQNGRGEKLLELLSTKIQKKKPNSNIKQQIKQEDTIQTVSETKTIDAKDILNPLSKFFSDQNAIAGYAENLGQGLDDFLERFYYFRNYLRDLFNRDIFIVRGYKGTGKTLLYAALEKVDFVERLKQFSKVDDDFIFINIIDPNDVLELKSLGFNPHNVGEDKPTYYRRFWIVYIWNVLLKKLPNIYVSNLPTFDVLNDETTRQRFEAMIQSNQIIEVEQDLKKLNEKLRKEHKKVVISFDFLDKVVEVSNWEKDFNPISQLIKFGQFNSYSNLYPKIFIRTDLFEKIHGINNVGALENKVLSLDWGGDELFAYFFKVVYQVSGEKFIDWLRLKNPEKYETIYHIENLFKENEAQIPLEQKEMLVFLVNSFFGEYVNPGIPNFGKSYEWFYNNLKNANDVVSLRPFIALLDFCFKKALEANAGTFDYAILPGKYFTEPAAREAAARTYLADIWKDYPRNFQMVLNSFHNPHPALARFRYHSITHEDLTELIKVVFEIENQAEPQAKDIENIINLLRDAGIIRYNPHYKKYPYAFAYLYKYYLGLKGNP